MAERDLSEQIRQAYRAGSSGGSDDWHPTVYDKYQDRITAYIQRVLSETDLSSPANLEQISRMLTRGFIEEAKYNYDIVHSAGFNDD